MEPLKLTKKQYEIAFSLKNGVEPKELARSLGYKCPETVASHVAAAMRGNGAKSRDQFFAWLGERGAVLYDRRKGTKLDLTVSEFLGYRARGLTYRKIANYIGTTEGVIQYWVIQRDLQRTPCGEAVGQVQEAA